MILSFYRGDRSIEQLKEIKLSYSRSYFTCEMKRRHHYQINRIF